MRRLITKKLCLLIGSPWSPVYEGEEEAAAAAAAEKEKAEKERIEKEKAGAGGGEDEGWRAGITQEQFNKILASDRRKHQTRNEQMAKQLQELQKSKGLTEKEKSELQTRIEELNTAHMTEKERADQQRRKLAEEHKAEKEKADQEKELWKKRYSDELVRNRIISTAADEKVSSAELFEQFFTGRIKIVEDLDEGGNPTGTFTPKAVFKDTKDGKPITLELTIPEAAKRMKELPERFGVLFQSTANGGVGGSGGSGGTGGRDASPPSDPQLYRKWRETHMKKRKTT